MEQQTKEVQAYYQALEKEKIDLYEQYISNSKMLELLYGEMNELKGDKRKKDAQEAKIKFGLWLGWLIGIVTSIMLKVFGMPDLSLIINIGAVAFLVPTLINKILEFPNKEKYVAKKSVLREKINHFEIENKKITETLLEIKNQQTKALLTSKANNHSPEFEYLKSEIKKLKQNKVKETSKLTNKKDKVKDSKKQTAKKDKVKEIVQRNTKSQKAKQTEPPAKEKTQEEYSN